MFLNAIAAFYEFFKRLLGEGKRGVFVFGIIVGLIPTYFINENNIYLQQQVIDWKTSSETFQRESLHYQDKASKAIEDCDKNSLSRIKEVQAFLENLNDKARESEMEINEAISRERERYHETKKITKKVELLND